MKVNSENIYKDYRKDTTEKIIPLFHLGESIILYGDSGIGKSKYLRHLNNSPSIKEDYLQNIETFYIDLNILFEPTITNLIGHICKEISDKECDQNELENIIKNKLETSEKVLFIFDHAERFKLFQEDTISYLKAIKDKFKYKLCYLIGMDISAVEIQDNPISRLSSIYIELEPLSIQESIENIKFYSEIQNINLSNDQIRQIAEESKGIPSNIKQILIGILAGNSIENSIDSIHEWKNIKPNIANTKILDEAIKTMTKSEYIVFKEMYYKRGEIITRDELALILNPESNGDGVSNESIDQLMSRIRKASAKLNLPIEISTKRGVGYYIE